MTSEPTQPAQSGTVYSVTSPPQVWHLARFQTFADVIDQLQSLDAENNSGLQSTTNALAILLKNVEQAKAEAWRSYVDQISMTPVDDRLLRKIGLPSKIGLTGTPGIPMVEFMSPTAPILDLWGYVHATAVTGSSETIQSLPPFQPLDLSLLPSGSITESLDDPRHAATGAIAQVLHGMVRDAKLNSSNAGGNRWNRLINYLDFINQAAREGLRAVPPDCFRNWKAVEIQFDSIDQAPRTVAEAGTSIFAQKAMALFVCARFGMELIGKAERSHSSDKELRIQLIISSLSDAEARLTQIQEAMARSFISAKGLNPSDFTYSIAFQPISRKQSPSDIHTLPVLIAVPVDANKPAQLFVDT